MCLNIRYLLAAFFPLLLFPFWIAHEEVVLIDQVDEKLLGSGGEFGGDL